MCICLCLGLKTLLNTFIRGMSYSSNEIWRRVWYFVLWRVVCVTMNIVIEYLVLFSTTMIYVIVSASYIVWSNSQSSRTQNNSEENSAGRKKIRVFSLC